MPWIYSFWQPEKAEDSCCQVGGNEERIVPENMPQSNLANTDLRNEIRRLKRRDDLPPADVGDAQGRNLRQYNRNNSLGSNSKSDALFFGERRETARTAQLRPWR